MSAEFDKFWEKYGKHPAGSRHPDTVAIIKAIVKQAFEAGQAAEREACAGVARQHYDSLIAEAIEDRDDE